MKKLILIPVVSLIYLSAISQDMFAGTWKNQTANEVFIVTLWKAPNGYQGHYKKIIVDTNGNEVSVVYNSNKPIGNSTSYYWPMVIYSGNVSQNNKIGGTIIDNTVINPVNEGGFISGRFVMRILNPACVNPGSSCVLQTQWTVKKGSGLRHENEPDFNLPTDIILTKQ